MKPADLIPMFSINHHALHANVAGVTNDEALVQPVAGNCLNWVVGHIVANRNPILTMMGREPIGTPHTAERYKRGSAPVTGPEGAVPFDRLVRDFDESQERILSGLASLTEADLERPHADETVGHWLAFLHFHEAYHIGQTGLLRRIMGKEGAIR